MAAPSFSDLHAWQLADELKARIFELVRSTTADDVRFRRRLRQAAASAPLTIADAVGLSPLLDARERLRAANGSLMEASRHLEEGLERGYFSSSEIEPLLFLARRASAAATSMARYIDAAVITRGAGE